MLQQPVFSLFIRLIPEAFIIIYSICLLTETKIDNKRLLISSIIGCIGVYVTRLLPIHFGVHTIIAVMLYTLLAVKLSNIEVYKAIATTLVAIILLFVSDTILVITYIKIFHFSSKLILGETWVANVAGMPSLIIFYLIVKLIVLIKKKRNVYEQG